MLYTDLTRAALRIAYDAHRDQLDRSGVPYIYHPLHLAEQMDNEFNICVALLHDVFEDATPEFEALVRRTFPQELCDTLDLLRHCEGVPYEAYIDRIARSGNRSAIRIKIADLWHNKDLTRLPEITDQDRKRSAKYGRAIHVLKEAVAKAVPAAVPCHTTTYRFLP